MSFEKELYDYSISKMHLCMKNDEIPDSLFRIHNVNRGLRDIHGKGVLTGLTRISEITAFKEEDGKRIPCEGQLWYRGYDIRNLVDQYCKERFAFEKLTYLLIFGELPDEEEAHGFINMLHEIPGSSDQLCTRRYHESAFQRYYEFNDTQYVDPCII